MAFIRLEIRDTMTKSIDCATDIQNLADNGESFDAQLAELLDKLGECGDTKQLVLLEYLRDNGNNYAPDDIEAESYDDSTFRLNPHTTRDGTSPAKALCLVGQLLLSLAKIKPPEQWTREAINEIGYGLIVSWLEADCPADLRIGLHDIINTLYFVSDKSDDYNAKDHRDTIREVFDGAKIIDRTKLRETEDARYLVLTDDEADERFDQYLEGCLDDEGIVPGASGHYFDRAAWKRDAAMDGRGSGLSGYDGEEHDHRGFFIYQVG